MFEFNFNNQIQTLLAEAPPEHFWIGNKHRPVPIAFSPDDPDSVAFVASAAKIRADMFGISAAQFCDNSTDPNNPTLRNDRIAEVAAAATSSAANPEAVFINSSDIELLPEEMKAEARKADSSPEARLRQLSQSLTDMNTLQAVAHRLLSETDTPFATALRHVREVDFDKDSAELKHMDFVLFGTNLRARNYFIPPEPPITIQRMATNIIPAVITATACASSLMLTDLPKLFRPIFLPRSIVSWNIYLGNNAIKLITPPPPVTVPGTPFTEWDGFYLSNLITKPDGSSHEITVQDIITYLEQQTHLTLDTLNCTYRTLYNMYLMNKEQREENLPKPLSELVTIPVSRKICLTASCSQPDGHSVDLPNTYVQYPPASSEHNEQKQS